MPATTLRCWLVRRWLRSTVPGLAPAAPADEVAAPAGPLQNLAVRHLPSARSRADRDTASRDALAALLVGRPARRLWVGLLTSVALAAGCLGPVAPLYPPKPGGAAVPVW